MRNWPNGNLFSLAPHLYKQLKAWRNWDYLLGANQYIDDDIWNHKNRHPRHDLTQTCRVTKTFLIKSIKRFKINECLSNKYDTHKSTINKRRLERINWGYFRSIKAINLRKQVWTPNQHHLHKLSQTCGGMKSICQVWKWSTDNFLTHPRTNFTINELWYYWYKQRGQESMTKIWKL